MKFKQERRAESLVMLTSAALNGAVAADPNGDCAIPGIAKCAVGVASATLKELEKADG